MTSATASDPSAAKRLSPAGAEHWSKPGPGSWELDTAHFSPDCSRVARDAMEANVGVGMADGMALVGGPIKTMDAAFVNGRFYRRLVPIVGGNVDRSPPPDIVLKVMMRLLPAFRRAEKKAGNALARRVWNSELERWEQEWKPQLVADARRLGAVDPASLSDAGLADHLDDLLALLARGMKLHFRLHVSDLGPIGILLLRTRAMGLDDGEVMAGLAGSSPSTSAPGRSLLAIREMVEASSASPATLSQLREISSEIDAALASFLDEFGWRISTGYDLRDQTLSELPEVVFRSIMNAREVLLPGKAGISEQPSIFDDAAVGMSRQEQAEFYADVREAAKLYGLRDENGPLTYEWPAGLTRRAILEVGRRLDAAGALPEAGWSDRANEIVNDAVFDLTGEEMVTMMRGQAGPPPLVIEDRLAERRRWPAMDAPTWLGPPMDDPNLEILPPNMRYLMRLILTVLELLEFERDGRSEDLQGVGIGSQPYVGRACVVSDASEALAQMRPGDVVVARFTVPTFNSVLAMAGAVVVDSGGLLCHAAVIAREYGIPGVVGAGSATTLIPNGATVEVDPTTGRVRILDQQS